MAVVLFALFLLVPIVELTVIITVGARIGVVETLGLMILMSALGAFLAKRQGLRTLRVIRDRLDHGQVPGKELLDGLLILIAAALMLTPGFVTDAAALLLLLPPVRAGIRRVLRGSFERRVFLLRADPGPQP